MAVSFRVVLLVHDKSRVRAAVFSSDTREWSFLPWVKVPAHKRSGRRVDSSWILNRPGMEANGCLYWAYADKRYLISFDTATMEFSISKLPHCLRNCTFNLGKTANGATCIVYPDELDVGVLMHTRDDDGVERWVQDRVVPLGIEFVWVLRGGFNDVSELFVLAVRDGYAYLTTSPVYHDPQTPCWFMSLCLETMELEILFRRTFDGFAHPYIMAWPLSFVGNYGRFALEDAP
uniref:F-box associated domain-containing protein n=1 Tax=Arundo donax TaxID=35708 RepID=A0A0A9AG88_ARUDO